MLRTRAKEKQGDGFRRLCATAFKKQRKGGRGRPFSRSLVGVSYAIAPACSGMIRT